MERGKSNTFLNILIIVLIISAGVFAYFYFKSDAELEGDNVKATTAQLTSQQIISLINKLEKITLDRDIVLRKDFVSLEDITQQVPPQPSGVDNPFLLFSF